ncbi:MAG TPA: protein phosphatase 2C domain-containing protein [Polyangiaceae bacterium]|nr:protein phosphatase 2C domain-containing protein [Polyangiaceae bacterium]
MSLPAVEYAERSDPGRDPEKQVNEDACGHRETRLGHLCVVCDGMGGHAAGREAAELALTTIFEAFDHAGETDAPGAVLRAAVEEASRRVFTMRTSEVAAGRPGSTVVAVLLHAGGTEVAHVGDSRAYLVHEGQIFRITRDHSMVQEMVDHGLLTPEQAAHHPDANRITRALGMGAEVEVEVRPQPVAHVTGDAFVLCSDGLCDLVQDEEIFAIVGSEPPAQAVGKLVDLANARGGHDNVTVIVLRARENALVTAGPIAPTVVQGQTQAHTAVMGPASDTVVDPRAQRKTEPLAAVPPGAAVAPAPAVIPPAPEPPPPSSQIPTRRGPSVTVVVGIGLAFALLLLLAAILYEHFEQRTGKPSTRGNIGLSLDAGAAPTATTLVPQSVVVPPPAVPDGSLPPLDRSR